ncbi:MAG: universal stress protein [Acidimicrobiia bacterium]
MEKIVLAVDGSEHSKRAAQMAATLSRCCEAPVDIIHVVPEMRLADPGGIQDYARLEDAWVTQRDLLKAAGGNVLSLAASEVVENGGKVDHQAVLIGPVAREIVQHAEEVGADYIVMGRRGLGDLGGLLMGSVSHRVGQLTETTLVTTR